MRKEILFAIIAIFIHTSILLPKETNEDFMFDYLPKKVQGGYKSCSIYYFNYKFGETDNESKDLGSIYKFDNKGNIIERLRNIDSAYIYNFEYKDIYKYDVYDNRIEWIVYDKNELICLKEKYKYDDKGNRIEEIHFDDNGNAEAKYLYKYDLKCNLIERKVYFDDTVDTMTITYKYNQIGNIIEKIEGDFIYKYDDKGNNISVHFSTGSIYNFEYDMNGNIIAEYTQYPNENSRLDKTIKYDELNNIIKLTYYGKYGEPTYGYEYVYTK
ncbi:MAG: hypothetical protein WCR42_01485 [bacterium]